MIDRKYLDIYYNDLVEVKTGKGKGQKGHVIGLTFTKQGLTLVSVAVDDDLNNVPQFYSTQLAVIERARNEM